jgi:hypothetical protein
MSANFRKNTGFTYVVGRLDPLMETYLSTIFDEQTDYDVEDIMLDIKENKIFRQVALIKTLMFPLEILLTAILMDRQWVKEKTQAQKIYLKFLRKKITVTELKEALMKMVA